MQDMRDKWLLKTIVLFLRKVERIHIQYVKLLFQHSISHFRASNAKARL